MSNTTKTLAQAAQAVLDRWDSPQWKWLKHGPTADLMADLRKALAALQPVADHTDLLKMLAHRARTFPTYPMGYHMPEVFAALGEAPPAASRPVEADRGPDYGPAWLGAASARVLAQPEVAARHLREYAELLATAPTASAEPVTQEMLRAGRLTKAGRFVCSGVPGGYELLTDLYLAMRSAAPPALAVEQTKPTATLWRVRPLTGGDWTYYDFQPKYALADSTKEVQAFAEVDGKAGPAVEPLKDKQISTALRDAIEIATAYEVAAFKKGVRFAEKFHGIGAPKEGGAA